MGDSLLPPLVLATASPQLHTTGKDDAAMTEIASPPGDPSCPVKGMYCLLDLIMEQGNNGLGNGLFVTACTTLTISPHFIKS